MTSTWLLAVAFVACHRSNSDEVAVVTSSRPVETTLAGATSQLPEDPEAGARSVAQWRRHLDEEERERKLRHDRRHLREHRRLTASFRAVQQQYDAAPSERAVAAAQRRFLARGPQLEKSFGDLDHYGTNSRLVPEYRKLVVLLSDHYPGARIAALSGNTHELSDLKKAAKAQFQLIEDWLEVAEDDRE